jgi:hypothetical protein
MPKSEKMVLIVTKTDDITLNIEMFGQNLQEELKTYYLQQICAERTESLTRSIIINETT